MNAPRTGLASKIRHPTVRVRRLAHEDLVWAPGAVGTLAVAAGITALPVILHLASQAIGIIACVMLAVLVGVFATPALPIALIVSYLFQNLVIALISPAIDSMEQFNTIRAYNFVFTVFAWATVAAPYWLGRANYEDRFRSIIDITTVALVVVGVYFVIGLASNPSGALTYLRNIATPVLMFHIFACVAYRHRLSITAPLLAVALFSLAYGYVELLAHDELFRAVNGDVYVTWRIKKDYEAGVWVKELHETGRVMRSYLDTLLIDFLNTPLLQHLKLRLYRISGLTSISSAMRMHWCSSAWSCAPSAAGGTPYSHCPYCWLSDQRAL
jgi:hypothetical protein